MKQWQPGAPVTDAEILALYAPPPPEQRRAGHRPWVRMMVISSADGAVSVQGQSGALGSPADQRVFALARRTADAIVVGAATVRAEGYAGALVDDDAQRWRHEQGRAAHPVPVLITGSMSIPASDPFFTQAPRRPLVATTRAALHAHPERADRLDEVADVVACGERSVDPTTLVEQLGERGVDVVHVEGGPGVYTSVAAAGVLDEVQLSLSPRLVAGDASRILASEADAALSLSLRLEHVMEEDGMLLLRYLVDGELGGA
ncbi:MAG: dihydrofolate reductase family protein [Micrococcus sp.]|nr:dihydrofolate reductase family protein [Micrococcus sp.]